MRNAPVRLLFMTRVFKRGVNLVRDALTVS